MGFSETLREKLQSNCNIKIYCLGTFKISSSENTDFGVVLARLSDESFVAAILRSNWLYAFMIIMQPCGFFPIFLILWIWYNF